MQLNIKISKVGAKSTTYCAVTEPRHLEVLLTIHHHLPTPSLTWCCEFCPRPLHQPPARLEAVGHVEAPVRDDVVRDEHDGGVGQGVGGHAGGGRHPALPGEGQGPRAGATGHLGAHSVHWSHGLVCVDIPSPVREGSTLFWDHRGSILSNRAEI